MHTMALLAAADVAQPSGQLWRPLLIFGVIAGLMAIVVLLQVTDPRRRSADGDEPAAAPTPDPRSVPPVASEPAVDGSPAVTDHRGSEPEGR